MDLVRAAALLHSEEGREVSLSQLFALHELDKGAALSQNDLAARLRLEKSSVSRMAAEMERKGLLVRERDPDNRRLYRLRLTGNGHAVHREMGQAFHARYSGWVGAMTRDERDALVKALPALVRAIRSLT
jgi:DNA-binding MarR family transcriptional regulator